MKVVFLDIDGVLNNDAWFDNIRIKTYMTPDQFLRSNFDPAAVARLNRITEETGADIVLSTSWAGTWPFGVLLRHLQYVGITGRIIDKTPRTKARRNDQIKEWLLTHPEVEAFVILEDDARLEDFPDQEIRTCMATGLTDAHVELALQRLKGD